ncbi:MAG TPA: rhodanese-like domain-containing protein [Gammaproteobacteria bacterium]|nr:rhodanese-like domain-containing protein [Gammaproteobacteria bacterium]
MTFERLLEFSANHPVLVASFLLTLGLLLYLELARRLGGVQDIGVMQATALSNRENALFLDVREDKEYRDGHIPGAVHIPLKQLPERLDELGKYRDRPLVVCCRSGNRSSFAGRTLTKNGFERVYNLDGGMKAWQSAGLPVSKKQ